MFKAAFRIDDPEKHYAEFDTAFPHYFYDSYSNRKDAYEAALCRAQPATT